MSAVRIRHEDDIEARYLTDVPFAKLDTVIPTLRTWGIDGEDPELVGQFCYPIDGTDAYFEVIICREDA